MDVHRGFFLMSHFLFLEIDESKESFACPARTKKNVAIGMKLEVLDKSLGFVSYKLMDSFALFPVENLNAAIGFQVIDITDFPSATHS